jgi:hypothetical protein
MSNYGIDYGNGSSNIDPETGIRYGVINQNAVLQSWADSSEADYGPPTCPKCGNEAISITDESAPDFTESVDGWEMGSRYPDHVCLACKYAFDSSEAYGEEPLGFYLDDGEYKATADEYGDIFILESPYFTYAQYCSPCAPGACYLANPVDENGPRAYCFAPDWFDDESCPYPVYRVDTGELVYQPELQNA